MDTTTDPTGPRSARRMVYRATERRLTGPMRDFLDEHTFAVLATHAADGRMHVVPVTYLFDGGDNGRAGALIHIATSSASLKARNIAARPDVTVTVDDRSTQSWVSATGTARIVTGPASRDLNERLYLRTWGADALAVLGPFLHRTEDVTITITPTSWRAWDLRSTLVPALADAGVAPAALERLFGP
ncbi:pyridoxamine 5'-phosphate oxidase family protein [Streptomyces sp. HMX87]|uniref:pyridoxamine 5'-phosphate oxidase family protein n=1 Tax=Streptomyces sp. HMX87 TaxID=3390849 RepID=UPI003A897B31